MHVTRLVITVDVERVHRQDSSGLSEWLDLLNRIGLKATFFVTGDILRNFCSQVREAAAAGHEIASHGTSHPSLATSDFRKYHLPSLGLTQVEEEIRRSREEFEEKSIPVKGFRAVSFQIQPHILGIVSRHFAYDSSLSSRHGPCRLPEGALEIPATRLGWGSLRLGSPQMAVFGERTISRLLRWLSPAGPWVYYAHSFDLVPISSPIYTSYLRRRLYYQQPRFKLRTMIERFFDRMKSWDVEFMRCSDVLDEYQDQEGRTKQNWPK